MKAVLIIGIPGSGKTHLALHEYVPRFLLVDDPRDIGELVVGIARTTSCGIVVCDPHLTRPNTRVLAEQKLVSLGITSFEYVYFENDPNKAAKNLIHRNDRRGHINVHAFSRFYEIPAGVVPRSIWQPE